MQKTILLTTALLGLGAAASIPGKPRCTDFNMPIKVTANTKDFPADLNISDLLADPASLPDKIASYPMTTISVNYNISARFCEPAKPNTRRAQTLQVLVHGNTYTKDYWNTPASGETNQKAIAVTNQYSWIQYASEQGYPTLSIDLPCNGASTRADPINQCQLSLGAEALNEIITTARSRGLGPTCARKFTKVVYVGHSYGSAVGNALSQSHANSVDAYVLSGFSANLTTGSLGTILIPQYQPAALIDPVRFGNLPPGYLMASSPTGAQQMFYDGAYSTQIAATDYATRGTVATGEGLTAGFGQGTVPAYKGPLFVMNGNEDEIMCQSDPLAAFSGIKGNCSNGFSQGVKALYPNASPFSFYNADKTGHCLDFHFSAQDSFKAAHDFLKKAGF